MNNTNFFTISPLGLFGEFLRTDAGRAGALLSLANRAAGKTPAVNVFVGDAEAVFDVEIPGFDPKHVEINIEDRALTIAGSKGEGDKTTAFKRRFEIPFHVDADNTKAVFKNGILRVNVAKTEAAVPKKIEITEG